MRYQIREKFFHLGEDSEITDEQGRPVYQINGAIFSLHHTLTVLDLSGHEVAKIQQEIISLTPTFHITAGGHEIAEVDKAFFSFFVDRYTIHVADGEELQVTGSLFEHNYTVTRAGQVVATVSKQWVSLTDTYGVDIAEGENDLVILATVLALDLTEDEEHK